MNAWFQWTNKTYAAAVDMRAEGMSFGQIAKELGVTRNAVIGKFNRMNGGRGTGAQRPSRARPRVARAPVPKPVPVVVVSGPIPEPEPLMLPLTALTDETCRWGVGDPREPSFGFCGHPVTKGAYCAHHAARAYAGIPDWAKQVVKSARRFA